MFSGIPPETPYDLRFRLFGVSVRVHPLHWVMAALLGWPFYSGPGQLIYLPFWLFAVFSSVLLHEMGHVFMGRLFGSDSYIILYSFGGLAIGASDLRKRWQRVLVYLAGPVIQLVFLVLLYFAGNVLLPRLTPVVLSRIIPVYLMFELINLFWPLFNLLPLWPLDGGKISREILEGIFGTYGLYASLWISMLLAGGLALQVLLNVYGPDQQLIPYLSTLVGTSMFNALFLALFAINSFQTLQYEQQRRRFDDELPWER